MNQNHVREHLSAYLDKALETAEMKQVETHLRDCAECRTVFNELKGVITWMKKVPSPSSVGLETRLIARIKEKESAKRWTTPFLSGLATAMVALIVFVVVKQDRHKNEVAEVSYRKMDASDKEIQAAAPPKPLLAQTQAPSPEEKKQLKQEVAQEMGDIAADKPQMKVVPVAKAKYSPLGAGAGASAPSSNTIMRGARRFSVEATQPEELVIRNENDWKALLARIGAQSEAAAPPHPDFSKQMVVAVFMGQQPSAGYSIKIVSEEFQNTPKGKTLLIKVRKTSPPADSMSASVLTYPYDMKVLPAFSGPVEFQPAE